MPDKASSDSTNVISFNQWTKQQPPNAGPLDSGGGPPNDGDMEARVAKLEAHFEYIRKDLDAILAGQKEIVGHIGKLRDDSNSANQHLSGRIDSLSDRLGTVVLWSAGTAVAIVAGFAAVLLTS